MINDLQSTWMYLENTISNVFPNIISKMFYEWILNYFVSMNIFSLYFLMFFYGFVSNDPPTT
jgi:hypothetical protein